MDKLECDVPADAVFTDTLNTAGSADSSSKLYLIGAPSQDKNSETYSHDTAYIGDDGCLYSDGEKVLTAHPDIDVQTDTTTSLGTAVPGQTITYLKDISKDENGHVALNEYSSLTLPVTVNAFRITETGNKYNLLLGLNLPSDSISSRSMVYYDSDISYAPSTNTLDANISGTVNGHTINADVPADAVFTDTIYDDSEVRQLISDVAEKPIIETGVFTTTGSTSTVNTVTLGYRPSAVITTGPNGNFNDTRPYPYLILDGYEGMYNGVIKAIITDTGFTLTGANPNDIIH